MSLPGTTIEANGLRHHVVVEGSGDPVLLLHGFPDSSYIWRHQIPALTDAGFRVIAPDLRGMGDSEKPEGVEAYALTNHLADMAAILDALGVERARVVGHDWGAVVAWLLAMFLPDRVERLVALSVGKPGMRTRTIKDLRRAWYMFMFQFDEAEDYLARDDWANLRAWGSTSPDLEHSIEHLREPGALRAGLNIYRANADPRSLLSPATPLPDVTVPTLGAWSTYDFALTEEQMTASAAGVANEWRYERFEDVTHWIPTEAPDRLNALLLEFLP